MASSFGMWRVR